MRFSHVGLVRGPTPRGLKHPLLVSCVMLFLVSCGSDAAIPPEPMIESVQLNDVWILQQDSLEGNEALHTGIAEIRNDCLYVGDAVVVRDHEQLNQAEELIAKVKAGEEPEISLGGRGARLDDLDAQTSSSISRACPTQVVWFTAQPP